MRGGWLLQSAGVTDLLDRLRAMLFSAQGSLIDLTLALAVMLVAWAVATVVAQIVRAILRAARFNDGMRHVLGERLVGAHEPASMASWSVYWFLIVAGIVLAFDTLGFHLSESLAERMNEVLPRVLTAAILLVVGVIAAMALGALTRRFFETAGLGRARLRGQVVTVLFTLFTVLLALEQLGFAAQFVMAVGVVCAGAIGLALGLAFGLGCRDLARDFVMEYLRSLDQEESSRTR